MREHHTAVLTVSVLRTIAAPCRPSAVVQIQARFPSQHGPQSVLRDALYEATRANVKRVTARGIGPQIWFSTKASFADVHYDCACL